MVLVLSIFLILLQIWSRISKVIGYGHLHSKYTLICWVPSSTWKCSTKNTLLVEVPIHDHDPISNL